MNISSVFMHCAALVIYMFSHLKPPTDFCDIVGILSGILLYRENRPEEAK